MLPLPLTLLRCEEVSVELSEYLDGELGRSEAALVEIHLAVCGACARFAKELAATVAALHRLARADGAAVLEGRRARSSGRAAGSFTPTNDGGG